ncbi:MAG: TlpA family protein disulfide reductase [Ilumatobacter sp.]|jgi:peroxiredoxin|nr:MAG: TlpA family protein disulfide reductase [Ilumatobacter sp.]
MALRPRLLVVSLAVALMVGVVGGWAMYQVTSDRTDAVVMNEPGEYQEPLDPHLADLQAARTPGDTLPDVVLVDVDDAPVPTSSLTGGPLVINVWFSTCPPCARELADFAEVHHEVADRVRFVGVNPFDQPGRMVEFAAERDVTYELLRDIDGSFLDAVSLTSFPRTYLVDASGIIVAEVGEVHADDLRELIEEHF